MNRKDQQVHAARQAHGGSTAKPFSKFEAHAHAYKKVHTDQARSEEAANKIKNFMGAGKRGRANVKQNFYNEAGNYNPP